MSTKWEKQREESDAARTRTVTMSPATEQMLGTPMDTTATMQSHHNSPPMQASSSAADSDAGAENIAARAETTMSLDAIVTELNTLSTDAARDVVTAAPVILQSKIDDVRNLCHPWGVQLTAQKCYRPIETIKQELKMALTKRAMMLKSEAATEHIAAGAETTMSLDAIVTELNTLSTDAARDVVTAAQVILKGNRTDVRKLCNPWGVQLTAQKRHRSLETIKQELKTVLTKRAMMLKSETGASAGGADATEPNTSFTPPVPPPARLGKPRCRHNDEARGLAAYYSAATETEAPRARSRSPRMATLQGMARQMATLQATERMRT